MTKKVQAIVIVAADAASKHHLTETRFILGITQAFAQGQTWLRGQVGETFDYDPVPLIYHSPHTEQELYDLYKVGTNFTPVWYGVMREAAATGLFKIPDPDRLYYMVGVGFIGSGGMVGQDAHEWYDPAPRPAGLILPGRASIAGGEAMMLAAYTPAEADAEFGATGGYKTSWFGDAAYNIAYGAVSHELMHSLCLMDHPPANYQSNSEHASIMGPAYGWFPNCTLDETVLPTTPTKAQVGEKTFLLTQTPAGWLS